MGVFSGLVQTRSLKHGHQDFSLWLIIHSLPPVLSLSFSFFFFFPASALFFLCMLDLLSGTLFWSVRKYISRLTLFSQLMNLDAWISQELFQKPRGKFCLLCRGTPAHRWCESLRLETEMLWSTSLGDVLTLAPVLPRPRMHITVQRMMGNSSKGKRLEDKKHEMFTSLPFKLFKRHFILFCA